MYDDLAVAYDLAVSSGRPFERPRVRKAWDFGDGYGGLDNGNGRGNGRGGDSRGNGWGTAIAWGGTLNSRSKRYPGVRHAR